MTALHDLPGTRLLALFARRELSPGEYYEHLLAHIQRWNRISTRCIASTRNGFANRPRRPPSAGARDSPKARWTGCR